MATWPVTLPTKVIAGSHNFTGVPNIASFVPEVGGDSIDRQRYASNWETHVFQMALSKAELDDLIEFYIDDCVSGTVAFDGALIDGTTREWKFALSEPINPTNIRGGTNYLVQITLRRQSDF